MFVTDRAERELIEWRLRGGRGDRGATPTATAA